MEASQSRVERQRLSTAAEMQHPCPSPPDRGILPSEGTSSSSEPLSFLAAVPRRQPQAVHLLLGSHFLFAFGTQMKSWVMDEGVGRISLPKLYQLEVEGA